MKLHLGILVLVAAVLGLARLPAARAQSFDDEKSAKIKAAFLLNFAKFSEWPPACFDDSQAAKAPLVIAVVGDDRYGVGEALSVMVKDKTVHDRAVVVRRVPALAPGVEAAKQVDALVE